MGGGGLIVFEVGCGSAYLFYEFFFSFVHWIHAHSIDRFN
jgi:hypothetical protein